MVETGVPAGVDEGLVATVGVGVAAGADSTFLSLSFFGIIAITAAKISTNAIALLYCLTLSLSYELIFF